MKKYHISIDEEFLSFGGTLILGAFDGVHLGHASLVKKALELVDEVGVLLFERNPRDVFEPSVKHYELTPLSKKIERFEELGVKHFFVVDNDLSFFNHTKDEFIGFLKKLSPTHIVVGEDYTFGKCKEGKVEDLKKDFDVVVCPLLEIDEKKVSSRDIYKDILEGKVEEAMTLLGKPYSLKGKVTKGLGNGRTISFPTANLELDEDYLLPKSGVYKTIVHIKNMEYLGITNVGKNPTVGALDKRIVETYIGGLNEDLYDKEIEVGFLKYLRDERKFDSLGDLKAQLEIDKRNIE